MEDERPTYTECLDMILDDPKSDGLFAYAKAYAEAGQGMMGESRRVQCLYILNNLAHWRHPNAKRVREALRHYSKE